MALHTLHIIICCYSSLQQGLHCLIKRCTLILGLCIASCCH